MEHKNKGVNVSFEGVITLIGAVMVVLLAVLAVVYYNMRMDDAVTVTAECEVVDKYYKHNGRSESYYAVLSFASENGDFEKAIDVTEESYWTGLKIGDQVRCEVVYDGIGIIDITVLEENIDQHTTNYEWKELLIALGIVIGGLAVILGPVVYVCCKEDKEDAEQVASKAAKFDFNKRYLGRYRVTLRPEKDEDDEPRDLIIIETSGRDADNARESAWFWLDPGVEFEVVAVVKI